MAKYNINEKNNVINMIKKSLRPRPQIIPNDKYEAYQLALKKSNEITYKQKIAIIILSVLLVVTLTILGTRWHI